MVEKVITKINDLLGTAKVFVKNDLRKKRSYDVRYLGMNRNTCATILILRKILTRLSGTNKLA